MSDPLRVVQWATGNIGSHALRSVIEHPALELAGVYVYSPDKVGLDAGELCGMGHTGVVATGNIDDIVALSPDCALYMARQCDFDEVCRILRAGINIVTTRGEFHRPGSLDPTVRAKVEQACRDGASSIHSTGASPGFITEAVPLVLTSIERHLDPLLIEEFADLSQRPSPDLLFGIMGFGKELQDHDEGRLAHGKVSFGPSLELVAEALGLHLESLETGGEVAVARHRVEIAAGRLEEGTVAAQRVTVSGMRDGRAVLSFRATWYCTPDVTPSWDIRPTGWHVLVDGDAPLDVDLRFPVPVEKMGAVFPGYTANRAVNAVPAVCKAPPGICTILHLPQIVADLR